MTSSQRQSVFVILLGFTLAGPAGKAVLADDILRVLDIDPVWSGHPVGFALLTDGQRQFVGYYDSERRLTVASRDLASVAWHRVRLPEKIGWDSHNYIAMTLDGQGHIHLSANMHGSPLVYFRSTKPYDIDTLTRIPAMVGREEDRCTYPKFLHGPDKQLIFTYRIGGSGNGDQLFNVYDERARKWRRLLDQPLFSGEGKMNAYFTGPVQDRTGVFHLCWVWRDTPDCATNHDLSYARSRDLVRWETSAGKPLQLPITLRTGEIVDPVPAHGGMINGNTRVGFDFRNRPIISYHKFDERGNTQVYNARLENARWVLHQTSDWTYRWDFQGGGSIDFEIIVGAVTSTEGGLRQSFHNRKHGSGVWILNESTLRPLSLATGPSTLPEAVGTIESKIPGMMVRTQQDKGTPPTGVEYILKWETLGPNRDRPREGPPPPPGMLRLYEVRKSETE